MKSYSKQGTCKYTMWNLLNMAMLQSIQHWTPAVIMLCIQFVLQAQYHNNWYWINTRRIVRCICNSRANVRDVLEEYTYRQYVWMVRWLCQASLRHIECKCVWSLEDFSSKCFKFYLPISKQKSIDCPFTQSPFDWLYLVQHFWHCYSMGSSEEC